jgi:hypothetical protein
MEREWPDSVCSLSKSFCLACLAVKHFLSPKHNSYIKALSVVTTSTRIHYQWWESLHHGAKHAKTRNSKLGLCGGALSRTVLLAGVRWYPQMAPWGFRLLVSFLKYLFIYFVLLEIKPRALCRRGKHTTTKPYLCPSGSWFEGGYILGPRVSGDIWREREVLLFTKLGSLHCCLSSSDPGLGWLFMTVLFRGFFLCSTVPFLSFSSQARKGGLNVTAGPKISRLLAFPPLVQVLRLLCAFLV